VRALTGGARRSAAVFSRVGSKLWRGNPAATSGVPRAAPKPVFPRPRPRFVGPPSNLGSLRLWLKKSPSSHIGDAQFWRPGPVFGPCGYRPRSSASSRTACFECLSVPRGRREVVLVTLRPSLSSFPQACRSAELSKQLFSFFIYPFNSFGNRAQPPCTFFVAPFTIISGAVT